MAAEPGGNGTVIASMPGSEGIDKLKGQVSEVLEKASTDGSLSQALTNAFPVDSEGEAAKLSSSGYGYADNTEKAASYKATHYALQPKPSSRRSVEEFLAEGVEESKKKDEEQRMKRIQAEGEEQEEEEDVAFPRRLNSASFVAHEEKTTRRTLGGGKPPEDISGDLWKKGKSWMLPFRRRHVEVKDGQLSWKQEMVDLESLGFFALCNCVVDRGKGEQFSVRPLDGQWLGGSFSGSDARIFQFDASGSEHTAEKWIRSIEDHIRFQAETTMWEKEEDLFEIFSMTPDEASKLEFDENSQAKPVLPDEAF